MSHTVFMMEKSQSFKMLNKKKSKEKKLLPCLNNSHATNFKTLNGMHAKSATRIKRLFECSFNEDDANKYIAATEQEEEEKKKNKNATQWGVVIQRNDVKFPFSFS